MKEVRKWFFAAMVAVLSSGLATAQVKEGDESASPYVNGQMLVKFKPSMAKKVRQQQGAMASRMSLLVPEVALRNRLGESDWFLFTFDERTDPISAAKAFRSQAGVLMAEPARRVRTLLTTPNDGDWGVLEDDSDCYLILDPDEQFDPFNRLWMLDDVAAFSGWSSWPNTWYTAATKPRNAPLIAVIDSGADMEHPDFINAGGTTSDSAFGGQIDHSLSKYFRFGGIDPTHTPDDLNGHGTHVLGTALAAGNNGSYNGHGHIGTGYACTGMVLNVIDANGSGNDADVAAAMYYAADQGADVINMSLGSTDFSYALQDAVSYCHQKGTVVIAASNESGSPSGTLPPIYPAACSGAFAVTAAGPGGFTPTSYTTGGSYFDMAAPGGDLASDSYGNFLLVFTWSTMPRGSFFLQSQQYIPPIKPQYSQIIGTSMATPHVSGAAGMWLGKMGLRQSSGFTSRRVINQLQQAAAIDATGNPYGTWDASMGYGFLDMDALLGGFTTKTATGGTVEGIVYGNNISAGSAAVVARKGTTTISTTADTRGQYRFGLLQPGVWTITATSTLGSKVKKVEVVAGQENPGFDFYTGSAWDTTVPRVARLQLAAPATTTSLTMRHWAFDTGSGIDKLVVRVGTTPGNSNIKADTEITASGDTFDLTGLTMATGTTYYLRATYTNGAGLTASHTIPFTVGGTLRTISGKITLQNWQKHVNQRMGWVEVRTNTGSLLANHPLIIDRFGNYSVQTTFAGNLNVAAKVSHWLSKTRNVGTGTTVTNMDLSLPNGDCTQDNIVDIADYTKLALAFDATPDQPNWDEDADLNGDDVVDIADYTLLAQNFDLVGE